MRFGRDGFRAGGAYGRSGRPWFGVGSGGCNAGRRRRDSGRVRARDRVPANMLRSRTPCGTPRRPNPAAPPPSTGGKPAAARAGYGRRHERTRCGRRRRRAAARRGRVHLGRARSYDLMNDLMSLGAHRLWRREAVAALRFRPGARVLDLAGRGGRPRLSAARAGGSRGGVRRQPGDAPRRPAAGRGKRLARARLELRRRRSAAVRRRGVRRRHRGLRHPQHAADRRGAGGDRAGVETSAGASSVWSSARRSRPRSRRSTGPGCAMQFRRWARSSPAIAGLTNILRKHPPLPAAGSAVGGARPRGLRRGAVAVAVGRDRPVALRLAGLMSGAFFNLWRLARVARVLARHDALAALEGIGAAPPWLTRPMRLLARRGAPEKRLGEALADAAVACGPGFIKLGQNWVRRFPPGPI